LKIFWGKVKIVGGNGNVSGDSRHYHPDKTVFAEIYLRGRSGPALELKKMEKDFDEIIKDSRNTITMPVNEVGITAPCEKHKETKQFSSKSYREIGPGEDRLI